MTSICSVDNCGIKIHARGYCKNHYQRLNEYGRLNKVVTGEKIKHPLYGMWNKRRLLANGFCEKWTKDFWLFVKTVGDRPKNHYLAKIGDAKLCGPENFKWKPIFAKLENETEKEKNKRRSKEYLLKNPLAARTSNYKYNFGITLEEFNNKLWAQKGVCAICGNKETATYKSTGKIKNLSLDHCHTTDEIRGLLCARCNMFIGRVNESIEILQSAIEYLKKYR